MGSTDDVISIPIILYNLFIKFKSKLVGNIMVVRPKRLVVRSVPGPPLSQLLHRLYVNQFQVRPILLPKRLPLKTLKLPQNGRIRQFVRVRFGQQSLAEFVRFWVFSTDLLQSFAQLHEIVAALHVYSKFHRFPHKTQPQTQQSDREQILKADFLLVNANLCHILWFYRRMQWYCFFVEQTHCVNVLVFAVESEFKVFDDFDGLVFVYQKAFHRSQNMRKSIIFQKRQAISDFQADFDDFLISKVLFILDFALDFVFECILAELKHEANVAEIGANGLISSVPESLEVDEVPVGEGLAKGEPFQVLIIIAYVLFEGKHLR